MRAQQPLVVLLFVLHAQGACAQCEGNLFVNGDLNGTEGGFIAADNWSIAVGSPDLNDENGPLQITSSWTWFQQPLASPTGGTWQNIGPPEAISQQVMTTSGIAYTICLHYAQQPIIDFDGDPVLNAPFGVIIYANNVQVFSTPLTSESYVWQYACGSFVAVSSMTNIMFHGAPTGAAYGAIDGLCMQVDHTNGVQEALRDAVRLFPNPATEYLQVSGARTVLRATITNSAGQTMLADVNGNSIGLHGLQPGIYSVQCWFAGGGAPLSQRVVVQREQ